MALMASPDLLGGPRQRVKPRDGGASGPGGGRSTPMSLASSVSLSAAVEPAQDEAGERDGGGRLVEEPASLPR